MLPLLLTAIWMLERYKKKLHSVTVVAFWDSVRMVLIHGGVYGQNEVHQRDKCFSIKLYAR